MRQLRAECRATRAGSAGRRSRGAVLGAALRFATTTLALTLVWAGPSLAEDYSILEQSSVLGRNFGRPGVGGSPISTSTGDIALIAETAFYFKNLELLGLDEIDGETLFGVLLPLRLLYRADPNLDFELGAVLGQEFGDDDRLSVADPLIRLTYSPAPEIHIIAGTILPTHWIHDALLDDTHKLRGRVEQGFQLRVDRKRYKSETWINWRIREGRLNAEEFEIATANQLRFFGESLRLDLQALWAHAGGQKTADERLEQNLSFSAGGSWGSESIGGLGPLRAGRLGVIGFYNSHSGRNMASTRGSGVEVAGRLDFQLTERTRGRLHASAFFGDGLNTRRGDPLYSLDEYYQFGGVVVFSPLRGLQIETGVVGQLTDGELNFGYSVNFIWGHRFEPAKWLARHRPDAQPAGIDGR